MTKHPQNRAERLKLKKIKFADKEEKVSHKVRRQIKEQIKDQETQNALEWARSNSSLSLSGELEGSI